MSEGLPWVDRVMRPLGWYGLKLPASDYNPIYSAVMRGDETQGNALVAAILRVVGHD